jgi:hypothetical protein
LKPKFQNRALSASADAAHFFGEVKRIWPWCEVKANSYLGALFRRLSNIEHPRIQNWGIVKRCA